MFFEKHILYLAPLTPVAATQQLLLARAGYPVLWMKDTAEADSLLAASRFALVIFGPKLDPKEAARIAHAASRGTPRSRLVSSGYHPALRLLVDAYLEPQQPPDEFLRLVGALLMQAHGHPEISGRHVAYVDAERRYNCVSDGFCELLGYAREELLGMKIDEVTYPDTASVPEQFEAFRGAGRQEGRFILRHRDGSPVPVSFHAQVLPDGCMVSVLTPAEESSAA